MLFIPVVQKLGFQFEIKVYFTGYSAKKYLKK